MRHIIESGQLHSIGSKQPEDVKDFTGRTNGRRLDWCLYVTVGNGFIVGLVVVDCPFHLTHSMAAFYFFLMTSYRVMNVD